MIENKIKITGEAYSEPEKVTSEEGHVGYKISLYDDTTQQFYSVIAWNETGEKLAEEISVGSRVRLYGKLNDVDKRRVTAYGWKVEN